MNNPNRTTEQRKKRRWATAPQKDLRPRQIAAAINAVAQPGRMTTSTTREDAGPRIRFVIFPLNNWLNRLQEIPLNSDRVRRDHVLAALPDPGLLAVECLASGDLTGRPRTE